MNSFTDQGFGDFPGIPAEEAGIVLAHGGGIAPGTADGFGNDLPAYELTAAGSDRKADGPHTAVKIQDHIVRTDIRVFSGGTV